MTGQRYAILIGCQDYPKADGLQDLRCPLNDVRGMQDILNDESLGDCETIILENPTEQSVRRTIAKTCHDAKRNDTIFIYYSGHGKPDRAGTLHLTTNDTELDLLQGSAVSIDFIKSSISTSDAQNAVLLLDCCYSGAAGKSFSKGHIEDQLNATNRGSGIFIMSASTEYQTSQEKEEDDYGVFTKHIIEGVKNGEADSDRDGIITMHELYDYVFRKVTSENHQEPKKWEIDAKGTIVFSRTGTDAITDTITKITRKINNLENDGILSSIFLKDVRELIVRDPETYSKFDNERIELLSLLADEQLNVGLFRDRWGELVDSEKAKEELKISLPNIKPKAILESLDDDDLRDDLDNLDSAEELTVKDLETEEDADDDDSVDRPQKVTQLNPRERKVSVDTDGKEEVVYRKSLSNSFKVLLAGLFFNCWVLIGFYLCMLALMYFYHGLGFDQLVIEFFEQFGMNGVVTYVMSIILIPVIFYRYLWMRNIKKYYYFYMIGFDDVQYRRVSLLSVLGFYLLIVFTDASSVFMLHQSSPGK